LALNADALTCEDSEARRLLFDRMDASAAVVTGQSASAVDRQVGALVRWRRPGPGLRVLMIGPVNSPHFEHLALSMAERGHRVRAGGAVWRDGLAPCALPDAGIPVSRMTRPQPLWMRLLSRRTRPDLVHANWLPFGALAVLARARPVIAMAWGSDVYLAGRLERSLNRLAARRADMCLCDSAALRQSVIELGAPGDRVALMNWGVDLDAFRTAASAEEKLELRASLGLGQGPVVISPRGFKDLYNPTVVLAAFERVLARHPDAQLVLKHNGDYVPDLGPLSGSTRVRVVGHVPYEEMARYFRAADVCVSIPSTDSSPRSVWEAMACGCACVLSDLPWVSELIDAERDALVVPAEAGAVAQAMIRLLTDPGLRQSITDRGRELVEEHRNAAREMDRLEQLYFRLAGGSDRSPPSTASSSTVASSAANRRRE
jgi:glycosyltransferase involved in cell wall biosynthesis